MNGLSTLSEHLMEEEVPYGIVRIEVGIYPAIDSRRVEWPNHKGRPRRNYRDVLDVILWVLGKCVLPGRIFPNGIHRLPTATCDTRNW